MKELKQKVISLGIERGYLPKDSNDNVIVKFNLQYLRLLDEIGEASKELRLENEKAFKMELGDCLVLHTNCNYIVKKYLDVEEFVLMMDNVRDSIDILIRMSQTRFKQNQSNYHRDKQCLQLAYDKIVKRGGMLIDGDWFKPSDREYIEYLKLKNLKVVRVLSESLEFDNGMILYSDHTPDCCETHYLSFNNLDVDDFKGLEFDLSGDDFFERITDYGIALKPNNGHPVRVPGYGSNNGYYSQDLDLIITNHSGCGVFKEYDITECQELD